MTVTAVKPGLVRDQWHRYVWNGEGPLVGVTSILKLQDVLIGGDLAAWGGRLAALHMEKHPGDVLGALLEVSKARDIGTEVHGQIEAILLGQPVSPTERTAPYVYAFSAFLAAERPDFLGVEQRVANLRHRYAGTFDFAAVLRGAIALVDVKTGKSKPSHRLQLAGYAAAEFIGVEGDPEPHSLPEFRTFYVLLLKPEGYELVEQQVTTEDRRHFLELASMYHRIRAWEQA